MMQSYVPGLANMPWARWAGSLSWTVNLPITHCGTVSWCNVRRGIGRAYALGLEMGASQAVHVLIEVWPVSASFHYATPVNQVCHTHHLEAIELVGHFLDFLLLARLDDFDAFGIPDCMSVLPFPFHRPLFHATNHLIYSPGADVPSPLTLAVPLASSPVWMFFCVGADMVRACSVIRCYPVVFNRVYSSTAYSSVAQVSNNSTPM